MHLIITKLANMPISGLRRTKHSMRKIELQNPDILDALKRKDGLTDEINSISKKEEELIMEANKIVAKLTKENEKVIPLIKKELAKIDLAEYEEHSRTYLGKEGEETGKVWLEIADRLEEFKLSFKQRNEQDNSSNPIEGGRPGDKDAEKSS